MLAHGIDSRTPLLTEPVMEDDSSQPRRADASRALTGRRVLASVVATVSLARHSCHVNAAVLVTVGTDVTGAGGMPLARSKPRAWLLVGIAMLLAACTSARDRPSANGAPTHPTTTRGGAESELDLQLTRQLPREYLSACARLRSYQPLRADACPPLAPQGTIGINHQGSPRGWPRSYELDLASSSLNRISGRPVQTNGGHWTVAAARGRTNQRLLVLQLHPPNATSPSTCRLTMLDGELVTACLVPAYEQGGGYYGGHVAYAWRHLNVVYHVTIHGYANEPRVRLMMAALIAREISP